MNQISLKNLFIETADNESLAIYTLKDYDREKNGITYPSLYKLYMQEEDLTEFAFSEKHLENHAHWERLCSFFEFKDYPPRWRHELELKLKARALVNLMRVAEDKTHKSSYEANKFLLTGSWKAKEGSGRGKGRPSKEDIQKAASEAARAEKQAHDDLARLSGDNVIVLAQKAPS